ncbi:MAG: HAD-IA family hydrolase [Deltaproteobacteria bacterium]|nr:HAD-IA family hydrolase [Deltaproteobacteria bacterium]
MSRIIETDLIIFDLDGTLIDSSQDIAWSANRTLLAMDHRERDINEIVGHIGWGVKPLLEKLMPDEGPERILEARNKFLEFYGGHLVVKTYIYPGVIDTIEFFRDKGKQMAIVTNKPIGLSEQILDILKLSRYFRMVLGGDSLLNKKPHPEPVEKVVNTLGVAPNKAVIVGDSPVDCEAGKAAGTCTVGAAYGFRGRGELVEAGCDIIIDEFSKLKEVLK